MWKERGAITTLSCIFSHNWTQIINQSSKKQKQKWSPVDFFMIIPDIFSNLDYTILRQVFEQKPTEFEKTE